MGWATAKTLCCTSRPPCCFFLPRNSTHGSRGGECGLILFLRFIFLAMAAIAALCQYWFVSRLRGKAVAWSSALLVLCFIPFSLPAPSYNTIGMFGMLSALACFGVATFARPRAQYSAVAAILSGLAWMAAIIAYPTMPVVLLVFLALAFLTARDRSERLHLLGYAMICLVVQFCGACLLLLLYSWTRLWQIQEFSSHALQSSEDQSTKFAMSLAPLVSRPAFDMLCLAAMTVGIWLLVAGRDRCRDAGPVCCYWQLYGILRHRDGTLVPPARYRRATRPGRTLCHALFRPHRK